MAVQSSVLKAAPDVVPPHLAPPELRERLDQFFGHLDDLGRLDVRERKVYIYEQSFKKFLTAHFSPEFGKQVMTELSSHPDSILTSGNQAGIVRIRWATLLTHLGPIDPSPDLTYGRLGLDDSATVDALRKALQRRFPEMPDAAFEPETLKRLQQEILDAFAPPTGERPRAVNRFFNCLKRHLGFFGAVAVMLIIVGLLAIATGAGPAIVAALAAAGFGASVIAIVLGCLANPNLP